MRFENLLGMRQSGGDAETKYAAMPLWISYTIEYR
jgi:hypothetical protein